MPGTATPTPTTTVSRLVSASSAAANFVIAVFIARWLRTPWWYDRWRRERTAPPSPMRATIRWVTPMSIAST